MFRMLSPLLVVVFFSACRRESEFTDFQLEHLKQTYQTRNLFHSWDREWHGYRHAGARRGVRFVPYADEPDKAVELYEYASVAARKRADAEVQEDYRRRNVPYDPQSSIGISRFVLYGHKPFSDQRQKQLATVFKEAFPRSPVP